MKRYLTTGLLSIVAAVAWHPVLSQTPVAPPVVVVIPAKSGHLLEIEPDDKAALVLVDPPSATFRFFPPATLFVEASAVKGGLIRVLQVSPGESPTSPKVRWYEWKVGPPVPPAPVILPTAKLTAEPTNVKPGESTTLTWVTTGAEKVTLQGEPVDAAGTVLVQPSLPTNLFTLAAESSAGIVYSQTIVTVSDLPPPIPNPTPITEKGFRVLIVEETEERVNLPKSQLEILLSLADGGVRKFLEMKCVKDSKGNPEFRILDKDNDLSRDAKVWQDAWKIPHTPLPYLIATNGVTGFAGPLPKTPDETIAILQRIAGP